MKTPYILCAAIHYDDGVAHVFQPKNITSGYVMCGWRHHAVIHMHALLTGKRTKHEDIQGFLTSDNCFVNREVAREIAVAADQLIDGDMISSTLTSEDLY